MSEITELLDQASGGNDSAMNQVFERLFEELKLLARSRLRVMLPQQTLTPTSLVNELYLKLAGNSQLTLQSRRHFFACAGQAMRQIVIDQLRARGAQKRRGLKFQVTLTDIGENVQSTDEFDLAQAIGDLNEVDSALRQLVDLKFFAGMTVQEIAELTGRSQRSVKRDWARARAFLHVRLASEQPFES